MSDSQKKPVFRHIGKSHGHFPHEVAYSDKAE
jgi:hypothetical protein